MIDQDFFKRLFYMVKIPKEECTPLAKKFFNLGFIPEEKEFKGISMFDFGTKYQVPLKHRNTSSLLVSTEQLGTLVLSDLTLTWIRAGIKSITAKMIKKAASGSTDLRDSVVDDLRDSDLSDSQF